MIKKVISIILTFVMLFSVTAGSLTVDAATKNTVKTSISKVESKTKGFKVTWKKKSGIKGYQIQYSTSSKFKSPTTKTISSSKTTSKTISGLKGCDVKYYVRVRTYKTSKGKKFYSSWSSSKKVTTLKHKYSSATCTKAKICKYCKKTSGKALGHKYSNSCDTTCNVCKAKRTIKHKYSNSCDKTCNVCKATRTIKHSYKAATCITPRTCSICKETSGKALGHTEVIDKAIAPTCTETGLIEGKHCSACNEVLVAQITVAKLGHTEVIDKAIAPTCTETGLTEGKHCSTCNEVLVAQTTVAKLGHTEIIDKAVAPTCTETGLTEGKHCSTCNEVLVAQTTVAKLGHTEIIDKAVSPTCTETGLTEGSHCSVCKNIIVQQKIIEKLPHTPKVVEAIEPTCISGGLTEGSRCSICNCVIVGQKFLKPKGHSISSVRVPATADKEGYILHSCTVCSYSYEETPTPISLFSYKSNNNGTCSVVGISDSTVTNLVIPSKSPSGDTVIAIEGAAFLENTSIVTVTIPNTVSLIGKWAFRSCSNLKTVFFPENKSDNLQLDSGCFSYTGIEELDLHNLDVETISNDAFKSCKNLKRVTLGDVNTIEKLAFSDCEELETLIHSGKLTKIGERSFENCKKLTVFKGKNSQHNLDTVLQFSHYSFYDSGIRDIVFNKDVESISDAFVKCKNLGTVDLSNVEDVIGIFADSKMEHFIFPKALTQIPSKTFSYVEIDSLTISDSVTKICKHSFKGADINKITFGTSLTKIESEAFLDADASFDFSKVYKPLSIGQKAFANNKFTTLLLPKSTIFIDKLALYGCNNLETLSIPFIAKDSNSSNISTDCFGWIFGDSVHVWEQDEVIPKSLKTVMIHGENPAACEFFKVNILNLVVGNDITAFGRENFESDSFLERVFYEGTEQEWSEIDLHPSTNTKLLTAEKYFYSATRPTSSGNFWHYNADGLIEIW